jgi:NADH pyrophosphatase NudC (nudix superfamily)
MTVSAALAGAILGFLAGLLSFRVKSRWCPTCGDWTFERSADHDECCLADQP